MRVYLAGPINGCTDDEAKTWRDYVSLQLQQADLGIEVFDPMVRDYRGRELEPGIAALIVEQDKADIVGVDTVLVCFDKPSVGTAMEVLFAWQNTKCVIVVNLSGKSISPWMLYHCDIVVSSLDEALELLVDDAKKGIRRGRKITS